MSKRTGSWFAILFAAVLVVLAVRYYGVFLLEIPEDGERPVFMAGDRVVVDRTAYGLRLSPMSWWGYTRIGEKPVKRGEWVAFNIPLEENDSLCVDEQDIFVGYCLAVPGDSLWIDRWGEVHRHKLGGKGSGRAVELPRKNVYMEITPENIRWYCRIINRHEGVHAAIIHDSLCVSGHFVSGFRFNHDYYWMSSANRDNHADSRTFGFVPDTHIIGRLRRVLYSWNADTVWHSRLRGERTLMQVGCEKVDFVRSPR